MAEQTNHDPDLPDGHSPPRRGYLRRLRTNANLLAALGTLLLGIATLAGLFVTNARQDSTSAPSAKTMPASSPTTAPLDTTGRTGSTRVSAGSLRWKEHVHLGRFEFLDIDSKQPSVGNIPEIGEVQNLAQSPGTLQVNIPSEPALNGSRIHAGIAATATPSFDECRRAALKANPTGQDIYDLQRGQVLCVISADPDRHLAALFLTSNDSTMALGFDVKVWKEQPVLTP